MIIYGREPRLYNSLAVDGESIGILVVEGRRGPIVFANRTSLRFRNIALIFSQKREFSVRSVTRGGSVAIVLLPFDVVKPGQRDPWHLNRVAIRFTVDTATADKEYVLQLDFLAAGAGR